MQTEKIPRYNKYYAIKTYWEWMYSSTHS